MQRWRDALRAELTWRHVGRAAALVLTALVGAWIGLTLGAERVDAVGPLQVSSQVSASLTGDTVLEVPPLGEIILDTHDGPLALHAQVVALDADVTEDAFSGDASGVELGDVPDAVRDLLLRAYLQAFVTAVLGAALAVLVLWRRPRWALFTATATATVLVLGAAAGALTWNDRALAQPRYTGLLVFVPRVVGDADAIVDNFEAYGEQLADLVDNVAQLSITARELPTFDADPDTIRVLHVSDIHLNPNVWPVLRSIVERYDVDVVIDTGDIADQGTAVENQLLDPIETIGIPYVYIRGNHDSSSTEAYVAAMENTVVLDGEVVEVAGLTVAGIGDPRFTPDRSTVASDDEVVASGEDLASVIGSASEPVDVALVHDPTAAEALADTAPLVLAGHMHTRDEQQLGESSLLLVQGSTGGAGLRALESEEPTPLTFTVLYFDRVTQRLTARDEFTLGGLGTTSAEVRRVVEDRSTP